MPFTQATVLQGQEGSREMEVTPQGPFEEAVLMQLNKNNQGVILKLPGQKRFLSMEHFKGKCGKNGCTWFYYKKTQHYVI